MPFPLKVTHSTGKGLSLFTEAAVFRSTISRADKIYSVDEAGGNSTFQFWILKIRDEYRNDYEWRDFSLPSNPSKSSIADAIIEHLTTNVFQLPYNEYIENQENILHTVTVGDGDEGVGGTVKEIVNR
jgi:hypothetical protein